MRTVYGVIAAAAALQLDGSGSAWAQNYSGAYVGSYTASAAPGQHRITLSFTQTGSAMSRKYATSTGVGGQCDGFLVGNVAQLFCRNTTPSCYGNYQGPYTLLAPRCDLDLYRLRLPRARARCRQGGQGQRAQKIGSDRVATQRSADGDLFRRGVLTIRALRHH